MLKPYIYNLSLIGLYIILCAASFLSAGHFKSDRIWDDYYIVGIPEGGAFSAVEVISSDGIISTEIVSAYNTEFDFNDFGTIERTSLSEIGDRFVAGDPRLDDYITGADDYFFVKAEDGSRYELIYVKSRLSELGFFLRINKLFDWNIGDWVFPDINLKRHIISFILFAAAWFLAVSLLKGLRLFAFISGLPWALAVISAGPGILSPAVIIFVLFSLFIRETFSDILYYLNHRKFEVSMGFASCFTAFIAALVLFSAIQIKSGLPVAAVFISAAADFVIILLYYRIKRKKVMMQEHRLFFPVRMSGTFFRDRLIRKLPEMGAVMVSVMLIPMFVLFFQYSLPVKVPAYKTIDGYRNWSRDSLYYIGKSCEGLVNASDYVTHMAFQEGFMYGHDYSFPAEDEKIISEHYIFENNKILYSTNCVQQFTDEWYTSIINPKSKTGLTALLLNQEIPGEISYISEVSSSTPGFKPVRHFIACLLVFFPITGQLFMKVRFIARRRGQEA